MWIAVAAVSVLGGSAVLGRVPAGSGAGRVGVRSGRGLRRGRVAVWRRRDLSRGYLAVRGRRDVSRGRLGVDGLGRGHFGRRGRHGLGDAVADGFDRPGRGVEPTHRERRHRGAFRQRLGRLRRELLWRQLDWVGFGIHWGHPSWVESLDVASPSGPAITV